MADQAAGAALVRFLACRADLCRRGLEQPVDAQCRQQSGQLVECDGVANLASVVDFHIVGFSSRQLQGSRTVDSPAAILRG